MQRNREAAKRWRPLLALIPPDAVRVLSIARSFAHLKLHVALRRDPGEGMRIREARVWLGHDGLFGFVQMLLEVGHERRSAGAHHRGVGRTRLMLAVDVAVGIADVNFPELGQ